MAESWKGGAPRTVGPLRFNEKAFAEMNVTDPGQGVAQGDQPEFRVVVAEGANGTVVLPYGELDVASGAELEAVLLAQSGPVVVDLRGLSFVDATGLRVLLEAEARSRQDGMNLRFIAGGAVRRLFELAGLADQLTYIKPPLA